MARATVPAGTPRGQTTDARRGVSDEPHTWTPAPSEVLLENVDILGDFGDGRYVAGNATLAELLGRTFDDSEALPVRPNLALGGPLRLAEITERGVECREVGGACISVHVC